MPVKVSIEGRGIVLSLMKGGIQKAITLSASPYNILTKLLPVVYRAMKKNPRELDLSLGEEVFRLKTLTKSKRVFLDIRLFFFTGEDEQKMIATKQGVTLPLEETPKLIKDLEKISHEVLQMTEQRSKEKHAVLQLIMSAWMSKCKKECVGCLNDLGSQQDHYNGCIRRDYGGNEIAEDNNEVRDFLLTLDAPGMTKNCQVQEERCEEIILDVYASPEEMK